MARTASPLLATLLLLLAVLATALPPKPPGKIITVTPRDGKAGGALVFAHFMVGIVQGRTSSKDYDGDMKRAKDIGIDALALNVGADSYTPDQLGYAYQSAADNGMKVFISFDFSSYSVGDVAKIGAMIAQYGKMPGQLMVDGKVFASSFIGDALDVKALRAAAGVDIFWAPNAQPAQADFSAIDGALNWAAWPSNGHNQAPDGSGNVTVQDGDDKYTKALNGKAYIAPISPWFFTHYGPEVSYSKNFVFPSDTLWIDRWNEILALKPRFVEIITWNDYGESSYIGPLSSPHNDDGGSKWSNDMPHDGFLELAKPYIAALKAGASSADQFVTDDQLVYWYRPTLRTLNCDSTDTTMAPANNASGIYFNGRPYGWQTFQDSVYVAALLKSAGSVTVVSGGKAQSFDAPAGISLHAVDMQNGPQQFFMSRDGNSVLSAQSLRDVSDVCPCGLYNFNAYVGIVPDGPPDQLQPAAFGGFAKGLKVSTCSPVPSLPTGPIKPTSTPSGGGSSAAPPPPTSTATARPTPIDGPGGPAPTSGNDKVTTSSTSTTTSDSTPSSQPSSSVDTSSAPTSPPTPSPSPPTPPPSSSAAPAPPSTSAPPDPNNSACIAGTGTGNYAGLCGFACGYGYCPPGPCTCTSWAASAPQPPAGQGKTGQPLPGEDDSYLGLCQFSCSHGYCPDTACVVSG